MLKKALIAGAAVAMLASVGTSFGAYVTRDGTVVRDGYRHPSRVVVVNRPVVHPRHYYRHDNGRHVGWYNHGHRHGYHRVYHHGRPYWERDHRL